MERELKKAAGDVSHSLERLRTSATAKLVSRTLRARQKARAETVVDLERPDALTVVLCGTGSPIPSKRAQACTAIFVGGQFLVFDVGNGAARTMEALNIPVGHLNAIFLTHFHSDHIADLGETIDRSWVNGRREHLSIFGPEGTSDIVRGCLDAYSREFGYRTAHHGVEMMPPDFAGATAMEFRAPSGDETVVVYEEHGIVVKAFKANHPPVVPAVSYRIEYAGKVVVVTGDTTATAALTEQSREADLLVSEVMNMDLVHEIEAASRAAGNEFNARILHDIRSYHMDARDLGQLAREAGVKKLALTHLIPPLDHHVQATTYFKCPIEEMYHGEIVLGKDGTRIVVPLQYVLERNHSTLEVARRSGRGVIYLYIVSLYALHSTAGPDLSDEVRESGPAV